MDHAGDQQAAGRSPSSGPASRQQEDHDMPDAQPTAPSPHERSVPPSSNTVLPSTEKPPPAAPKKRGQAAVKKPTKRSKGNPGSRVGKKQTAPKASSGDQDDDGDSAAQLEERGAASPSPDDDDSIDPGPYCLCRGPDDHRFMIFCDICQDWFHGECVDMDRDVGNNLVERFVCPNCTDLANNVRTLYKKTCSLKNCTQEARLYGDRETKEEVKLEDKSVFCSDAPPQLWWENFMDNGGPGARAALVAAKKDGRLGLRLTTPGLDTIGVPPALLPPFMATQEAPGDLQSRAASSTAASWPAPTVTFATRSVASPTTAANKKLNLEAEIRDAAVQRRLRKEREGNGVEYHGQYAVQLGDQDKSVTADGPLETIST
ncbi:conserved hypothetical protein [Verticillium alfalfae VaMs.102]|uniref:PHD-type domain-containing protein n=1 Tax=Verticillium alfalfae (strain VaMs.102 / ATCC MYA-4576 / FGSC 10136) TaxID=526221 RepID=C9SBI7_VERA1|nr:conserved hypothetical protein [Verticillium alfalfae VaMs.102]EEY15721.1 conserved hypothetical protein [Verticillium alfalfae VaMs.102]